MMADKDKANRKDFEEIALPHIDPVYRAAVALCGSGQEAEDLVQTTFLKAFEKFDTFTSGTDCKGWLMRILRNTWIDKLRKISAVGSTVFFDEASIPQPTITEDPVWSNARDLLENFSDDQVIRAMSELSDEQRLTLFLVDVEQLDMGEVAKILNVPVGTVKSRSNRARNILKIKLAAHAKDLGFIRREK
jgi:RNA polymerase sigma-70 factor, ECF subfamily